MCGRRCCRYRLCGGDVIISKGGVSASISTKERSRQEVYAETDEKGPTNQKGSARAQPQRHSKPSTSPLPLHSQPILPQPLKPCSIPPLRPSIQRQPMPTTHLRIITNIRRVRIHHLQGIYIKSIAAIPLTHQEVILRQQIEQRSPKALLWAQQGRPDSHEFPCGKGLPDRKRVIQRSRLEAASHSAGVGSGGEEARLHRRTRFWDHISLPAVGEQGRIVLRGIGEAEEIE